MSAPPASEGAPAEPLSQALKRETSALHREAERAAFVGRCLRGEMDAASWAAFLDALLPLYAALEEGLRAHRAAPAHAAFLRYPLARAPALTQSLRGLNVPRDPEAAALGRRFGDHLRALAGARGAPHRLLGHAYARYFGDLMGGQMLARRVGASVGPEGVGWLEFDLPAPAPAIIASLHKALDEAPWTRSERAEIVAEAQLAFRQSVDLFRFLDGALATGSGLP
ncbi:MAG: biliverdin-producing heme oxygenase [Myxococcota bacterium]